MEDYKEKYEMALEGIQEILSSGQDSIKMSQLQLRLRGIFPELAESKDEKIRNRILLSLEKDLMATKNSGCDTQDLEQCIAWLEKQGEQKPIMNVPTREVILSIWDLGNEWKELTNGSISTEYGTQLDYIQKHWYESEYYLREKQGEQKPASDTKYEVKDGGSLSVSASDYKYATITQKDFAPINDTDEEIVNAAKNTSVIDMVGPKFKVGDWVVTDKNDRVQIKAVNNSYYTIDNGMYFNIPYVDRCWHLWAVQDAKDGDVLALDPIEGYSSPFVCIYKRQNQEDSVDFDSHCFVSIDGKFYIGEKGHSTEDIHPATKEQRDLLFQKMEEAGYEWDAEKKELKKIEDEEYNGDDYGIDGLWHAQRILEKTLGSVDGYQSDDGILEHKAAITAVKKLYEQKSSWSYEDEANLNNIIWLCNNCINGSETTWIPSQAKKIKHLIKTVKKRGLSQQKPTEWSDEDERNLNGIIDEIIANRNKGPIYDIKTYNIFLGWLKSLKDRATWKPSDEQMEILKELIDDNNQRFFYPTLKSLYNDLKKL